MMGIQSSALISQEVNFEFDLEVELSTLQEFSYSKRFTIIVVIIPEFIFSAPFLHALRSSVLSYTISLPKTGHCSTNSFRHSKIHNISSITIPLSNVVPFSRKFSVIQYFQYTYCTHFQKDLFLHKILKFLLYHITQYHIPPNLVLLSTDFILSTHFLTISLYEPYFINFIFIPHFQIITLSVFKILRNSKTTLVRLTYTGASFKISDLNYVHFPNTKYNTIYNFSYILVCISKCVQQSRMFSNNFLMRTLHHKPHFHTVFQDFTSFRLENFNQYHIQCILRAHSIFQISNSVPSPNTKFNTIQTFLYFSQYLSPNPPPYINPTAEKGIPMQNFRFPTLLHHQIPN